MKQPAIILCGAVLGVAWITISAHLVIAQEGEKILYPLSIPLPKGSPAPLYDQREVIARDRVKLIVHRWTHPKVPADRPVVLFLHGIGLHGEPYASIAAGFTSRQITLVAPDLRGHGRSQGKRGELASAAVLRSDLGEVLGLVNKRHPEAPVFLAGESMGALLACDYAIRGERRLTGLVLLAPAFKVHDSQLKGFGEFLLGRVALNTEKKLKPSTRDPGFIQARMKDSLSLVDVESGYIASLGLRQAEWPLAANQLKLPLFIGVAGRDEIVNSKMARTVFDLAQAPKDAKIFRQWDDARHTVCWDPLTPQIFDEVTKWVQDTVR